MGPRSHRKGPTKVLVRSGEYEPAELSGSMNRSRKYGLAIKRLGLKAPDTFQAKNT